MRRTRRARRHGRGPAARQVSETAPERASRRSELTDRSDALYAELDRPWDQAANWLFAARAAISANDQARSAEAVDRVERWLRLVDDPWLRVRRDAVLGELARIQRRFHDSVVHLTRAAEASQRLGFRQTEAYQLSSLGRAQCQAGDYDSGVDTLELAIAQAEATGDVRLAALARVHLGRILRSVGHVDRTRPRWCAGWEGTATLVAGSGNPMLNWPMAARAETTNVLTEVPSRLRTLRTERGMTPIELSAATGIREVAEFDTQVPHWFGAAGDQPVERLSLLSRPGERAQIRAAPHRRTAR